MCRLSDVILATLFAWRATRSLLELPVRETPPNAPGREADDATDDE